MVLVVGAQVEEMVLQMVLMQAELAEVQVKQVPREPVVRVIFLTMVVEAAVGVFFLG
jgi:hypothetical protein